MPAIRPSGSPSPRRARASRAAGRRRPRRARACRPRRVPTTPVKSAGATSPEKRVFQAPEPCSSARSPKRNGRDRVARHPQQLRPREVDDPALPCEQRCDEPSPRAPVGPEPLGGAVEVAPRDARHARRRAGARTTPRARSTRCASSSRPSLRNTGDASPAGCTAEHTSWRNPGSVSSAVRTPPPIVGAASSTRTLKAGAGRDDGRDEPVGPAADDGDVNHGSVRRPVLR